MAPRATVWALAGALGVLLSGCVGDDVDMLDDGAVDDAPGDVSSDTPGDASGGVDGPRAPGVLRLRRVPFNAAGVMLGRVQAVAEAGDLVALWGDRGLTMLQGGTLTASDATVTAWRAAAAVPAGDRSGGTWLLGVDTMGRVWRVRDARTLENVTARYTLEMRDARTVAPLDATRTAFGMAAGFAIADGMRVLSWDDPTFATMVAGGGRVATRTPQGVRVFDAATRLFQQYPLQGVTGVGLDGMGRLHVTAGAVYYAQDMAGQLVPRVTAPAMLRDVTVSGSRVWLVVGSSLGAVEDGALSVADDVMVPAGATLHGSPSGDLWVLTATTVERYGIDDSPDRRLWEETVRPVFSRRCTPCHLPGGTAGIDLSTYASWVMRRASVRTQVFDTGAMPPNPPPLSADDRAALARWLGGTMPGDGGVDAGVAMDAGRDAGRDVGVAMDVRDAGRDTGPTMDVRDAGPTMDVRDAGRDTGPMADVRDAGRDTGPSVDVRDAGAPTMAAVQAIFTRACVSCHGSAGGLSLANATTSRTNLVNRAAAGGSCSTGMRVRVVPGNPTMSLLYQKITNTQTCGTSMPRNAAMLPAADQNTIRNWIAAGALP